MAPVDSPWIKLVDLAAECQNMAEIGPFLDS